MPLDAHPTAVAADLYSALVTAAHSTREVDPVVQKQGVQAYKAAPQWSVVLVGRPEQQSTSDLCGQAVTPFPAAPYWMQADCPSGNQPASAGSLKEDAVVGQ